jgi:hypothetical protein
MHGYGDVGVPKDIMNEGHMPRRVEISVAADMTDHIVQDLHGLDGVFGLQVQRGVSRMPPGDVVTVDVTNRGMPAVMRLLGDAGVGRTSAASFSTSEPVSVVASPASGVIVRDSSEAGWEEMDAVMAKNSNMTGNALLVMGTAGVLATIGIATNALHIVLGAMLIAPGFQPIVRAAAGMVSRSTTWRLGVAHLLQGYAVLAIAAAATAVFLQVLGKSALGGEASYLPAGVLISYWTSITIPGLVVTAAAGTAGAILIATDRAVLTAGVMVGLALVPGAAITGLAAASSDLELTGLGATRWLVEVVIVLITSLLVLSWKQARLHRRASLVQAD